MGRMGNMGMLLRGAVQARMDVEHHVHRLTMQLQNMGVSTPAQGHLPHHAWGDHIMH